MSLPAIPDELLRRLDVAGPRYTSYPTAPVWSDDFGPEEYARALERAAGSPAQPLSIYVHVPFCRKMCSYCGCNVVIDRTGARAARYLEALPLEIDRVASHLGTRRSVSRLHLGGGTPTYLDEAQLARMIGALAAAFRLLPDAELSVEIDPKVTRPSQLATLRALGFRRLSLGVQDLDPRVQEAVGRVQTVEETEAAIADARRLGFASVNVDLIYGLPRQTRESWRRTLEAVVRLGPDRVATFAFAYVPSAKPHQRRLPIAELPVGRARLELLGVAQEVFARAGYRAIGIDHFALPDDELARAADRGTLGRDFQGYTAYPAGETVAFGPSAISDVGGVYAQNDRHPDRWERALRDGRLPTVRGHRLTDEDARRRALIGSLMCRFATALPPDLADEREALLPMARDGLLTLDGAALTLTPLGRLFARNVAMVFDAHLAREARDAAWSRTV